MSPADAPSARELDELRFGYATALDNRDPEALLLVFHPEAVIRIFPPGAADPAGETQGHDAIAMMPSAMAARFAQTMHVISNPTCALDGDVASGSSYCVAHHLILDDGPPRTFVAHIRYDDRFERHCGDSWLIILRDIRFLWCEEGGIPLGWEEAVVRGRLD